MESYRRMSKNICEYIHDFKLEQAPEEISRLAKLALMDIYGVIMAGLSQEQVSQAKEALRMMGRLGDADTVSPFDPQKTGCSVTDKVFLNAVSAHAMEYNDLYYGMPGHPSAVLGPVVFTMGSFLGSTGREVLEAYIAALEIQSRINQALLPVHHEKGFHSTSVSGVIGAALAAGKLMKLPVAKMVNSLALACTSACGLRRNFGTHANSFHAAFAAESGVRAAYLAACGVDACPTLLTETDGYLPAFYGDVQKADRLMSTLGKSFCLEEPGLLIKKYPACFSVYQCVDAALEIYKFHDFSPEDIKSIRCLVPELTYYSLPDLTANSIYGRRFCVPYCTAAALATGKMSEDCFHLEGSDLSRVNLLVSRTSYEVVPELRKERGYGFSSVEIQLNSGKLLKASAFPNPEERLQGWPPARFKEKFETCCRYTPGNLEKIEKAFTEIEVLDNISELLQGYAV